MTLCCAWRCVRELRSVTLQVDVCNFTTLTVYDNRISFNKFNWRRGYNCSSSSNYSSWYDDIACCKQDVCNCRWLYYTYYLSSFQIIVIGLETWKISHNWTSLNNKQVVRQQQKSSTAQPCMAFHFKRSTTGDIILKVTRGHRKRRCTIGHTLL